MCKLEEKEKFYALITFIVDGCSVRDTLIVLSDKSAYIGTDRASYCLYVGP